MPRAVGGAPFSEIFLINRFSFFLLDSSFTLFII